MEETIPCSVAVDSTLIIVTLARLEMCMQGKSKEHWAQLCEQAAFEQDSKTLMALINEINRMLDEKEQRLKGAEAAAKHSDQKSTASFNL